MCDRAFVCSFVKTKEGIQQHKHTPNVRQACRNERDWNRNRTWSQMYRAKKSHKGDHERARESVYACKRDRERESKKIEFKLKPTGNNNDTWCAVVLCYLFVFASYIQPWTHHIWLHWMRNAWYWIVWNCHWLCVCGARMNSMGSRADWAYERSGRTCTIWKWHSVGVSKPKWIRRRRQ